MIRILLVLFLLISVSCKDTPEIKAEYVNLYIYIRLANTEYGERSDSARVMRSTIFKQFKITEDEYIEYITGIQKEPALWKEFQEMIIAQLTQKGVELDSAISVRDSLTKDSIARVLLVKDSLAKDSIAKDSLKKASDQSGKKSLDSKKGTKK